MLVGPKVLCALTEAEIAPRADEQQDRLFNKRPVGVVELLGKDTQLVVETQAGERLYGLNGLIGGDTFDNVVFRGQAGGEPESLAHGSQPSDLLNVVGH